MKKLHDFYWLKECNYIQCQKRTSVPKNEVQCQKINTWKTPKQNNFDLVLDFWHLKNSYEVVVPFKWVNNLFILHVFHACKWEWICYCTFFSCILLVHVFFQIALETIFLPVQIRLWGASTLYVRWINFDSVQRLKEFSSSPRTT
jgi:hypothetical protein